jgi:hypothetical protein
MERRLSTSVPSTSNTASFIGAEGVMGPGAGWRVKGLGRAAVMALTALSRWRISGNRLILARIV